jgi:hypothetical protein
LIKKPRTLGAVVVGGNGLRLKRAQMLLADYGRTVNPPLIFPDSFDARAAIFSMRRVAYGDLCLTCDPLQKW